MMVPDKTRSARAAPEITIISASIAPKYRAVGAVLVSFTLAPFASRHEEMSDDVAASLAGNSRETRRFATSGCRTMAKRCPQMFTGSNELTHDNFTTFFAVSLPPTKRESNFDGSAERR
jgi:hypothetical protein